MVRDCPGNTPRDQFMRISKSAPRALRTSAVVLVFLASAALAAIASAQQRPYHYFQRADMPPGSIGRAQLMRGGPLPGHFQAVEITAPEGTQLAMATEGLFEPTQPAPLKVGLLIGNVYRIKVTNLPLREGQEVFPSIEIINRLYPPEGSQARFPIPIQLTREELEMALRGQFVIRVIYLENPRTALPRREDPKHQRYFDVGPGQDPLEVADSMGRPMAILRIGSRVPELDQVSGRFLFESPPWLRLPEVIRDQPTPDASQSRFDTSGRAQEHVHGNRLEPSTQTPAIPRTDVPLRARGYSPSVSPTTAQHPQHGAGVNR